MGTTTRYGLIAIIVVTYVAGMACSPPVSAQSPQEAIADALSGLEIDTNAVELLPGEVRVTFEQPLGAGTDEMIGDCLWIMETAAEQVPEAMTVVVYVDYMGEPLLEIKAGSADIRALLSDTMGPDVFADRLVVNERRLPEQALLDNMATLGIWDVDLRLEGKTLHITFAVPDGMPPSSLFEMALQILGGVADKTAGLERTELHAEWPDGSVTNAGASMADVLSWRSGALQEHDLIARITWGSAPASEVADVEPTVPAVPLLDPLDAGP